MSALLVEPAVLPKACSRTECCFVPPLAQFILPYALTRIGLWESVPPHGQFCGDFEPIDREAQSDGMNLHLALVQRDCHAKIRSPVAFAVE